MIRRLAVPLSPLLLLALYPSASLVFLGDIRPWLLPLALGGIIYLQAVRLTRSPSAAGSPLAVRAQRAWRRFADLPPKAAAVRLFWAALVLYLILLSGAVVPAQPFTGDEPHYLLTARSLVRDGDINLANDYGERRYREFYEGSLRPHARPGKKGPDHLYSQHFPGISAVVAPFYALGRLSGKPAVLVAVARLPLAILSAILASLLFLCATDLVRTRGAALVGWALFALASPFVFYSGLIYSEIPPALITLFVLRTIVLRRRTSPLILALAGAGTGLMAWFNIKYLPLAGGVFLAAAVSVLLASKRKVRDLLRLSLPAAVPLAILFAAMLALWGGVSPVRVYRGTPDAAVPLVNYFKHSAAEVWNHFAGLLLDQRTGLFVWGPFLLLSVPGLILLLRRRRREGWLLLTPLAVWWIFSSAVHSWGGYCPPGRPLLPILPVFAVLAAVALDEPAGTARRAVRSGLVAATVLITVVCLRNPRLLYHANMAETAGPQGIYSHLLSSAKTAWLDATRIVPSLSNWQKEERIVLPVAFWLTGIGLLTWIWLRPPRKPRRTARPAAAHAAGVLILSLLVLGFVLFRVDLDEERSAAIPGGRAYLQGANAYGFEQEAFWTRGSGAATAVVRTPVRAGRITVLLSSAVAGEVAVSIGPRRGSLRLEERTGLKGAWAADAPVGVRSRDGGYLYAVRIRASRAFVPVRVNPDIPDGRVLGALARIQADAE
jgi:hypothetical protein